jgi:saccharopine dehydrogenase-like NADP-dependent oxidoreductase
MKNALVLGTGGVGSVIGQRLHTYDCYGDIYLGDVETQFADILHAKTDDSRFKVVKLDANDPIALATFIKENKIFVTINACPSFVNPSVLTACAEAGSNYIDMASDCYVPPGVKKFGKSSFEAEIEKYHDTFVKKDITAVLSMGMDPGAVNIFARWAVDRLDIATSIRVLDADNAEVKGYRFAVLFSPETLFEELGAVPYFVKDGRIVSGKPLETEVEVLRFPDPIGFMKTYAVAHEEGVSLGIYPPFVAKGVNYSVFKYTLSDKVVNIAKSLALLDLDNWRKMKVDGVEVSPVRVATGRLPKPAQLGSTVDGYSCVGTEVRGMKDGVRTEYFVYTMDDHRETYLRYGYSLTVIQTGLPPALICRLMAEGRLKERGVMMPEALDPEIIMRELPDEGIPIYVEQRRVEPPSRFPLPKSKK